MVWLKDGSPFLELRPTKASEPSMVLSTFQDVDFCSQKTFIETAFSRNLLPKFQRVPSLKKTALIGLPDSLQLLGIPRVYRPSEDPLAFLS